MYLRLLSYENSYAYDVSFLYPWATNSISNQLFSESKNQFSLSLSTLYLFEYGEI